MRKSGTHPCDPAHMLMQLQTWVYLEVSLSKCELECYGVLIVDPLESQSCKFLGPLFPSPTMPMADQALRQLLRKLMILDAPLETWMHAGCRLVYRWLVEHTPFVNRCKYMYIVYIYIYTDFSCIYIYITHDMYIYIYVYIYVRYIYIYIYIWYIYIWYIYIYKWYIYLYT